MGVSLFRRIIFLRICFQTGFLLSASFCLIVISFLISTSSPFSCEQGSIHLQLSKQNFDFGKMTQLPIVTNDYRIIGNIPNMNATTIQMVNTDSNNINASENCKYLEFKEYIPWNNPDNIVGRETEVFIEQMKGAFILPFMFVIGGPANVINIAVFYKQGLKERINLCLFVLAIVDEINLLIAILQNAEIMYSQYASKDERNGPLLKFIVNHNLIGFAGFAWISQMYSAIIASERCFCVVSPLRSHVVLTTRTMAVILTVVVLVILTLSFLVATRFRMVCVYDPVTNARFDIIDGGPFYYQHQEFIDYLDSLVFGLIVPGAAMLVVMVTTIVTTVKLRKAVSWRSETSGTLSTREVALTRMLVANSILFLACAAPFMLFRFFVVFLPEVKPGGRHHNLYFCLLWLLEIPYYVNSSFNIFVYYSMGSRYRETLGLILRRGKAKAKGKGVEKS